MENQDTAIKRKIGREGEGEGLDNRGKERGKGKINERNEKWLGGKFE